jgi:hypothetical protein
MILISILGICFSIFTKTTLCVILLLDFVVCIFYLFSHFLSTSLIIIFPSIISEKLNREDQNILRIASIIGDVFSTNILYGVLPPKLRTHMANAIASLVDNQWITEMPTDSGQFNFVHPLFYQTLYDVTPAGERARLHHTIGCCFEEKHEGDPLYFAQMGHHFGLAKDCRPKALEHFVRAAVYSMSKGPLYFDEGLELLIQSKLFADVAEDCQTMLSVVLCNRTKLLAMRRRLRDEDERKKRDSFQNSAREKIKTEIHNKFQVHNENESDSLIVIFTCLSDVYRLSIRLSPRQIYLQTTMVSMRTI